MSKESNFSDIYDSMTYNYGKLDRIMSDLYSYLKDNPYDDMAKDVLMRLNYVAQDMLYSQKELTKTYGDADLKEALIASLDSKAQTLSDALEETRKKVV